MATVFSIYLANAAVEGWHRLTSEPPMLPREAREDEAKRNRLLPDFRSKLEVVDELAKTAETYPSAYTHHILEDRLDKHNPVDLLVPLGLISNVQYVLGNESGQFTVFTYDRFGFQNNDSQYHRLSNGERPILLIGDSFVEGQHVRKNEDIASKMRERNLFALSFGMGGSGPIRELATLKEYGPTIHPKVVIWFFSGLNDIDDLSTEIKDPFLIKYLEPNFSQNLVHRQREIDQTWKEFISYKITEQRSLIAEASQSPRFSITNLWTKLHPFISLYWLRKTLALTRSDQKFNEAVPVFKKVLNQTSNLCTQWEASLVFVYLPFKETFKHGENSHNEKIKSIIKEMNIPMIDFTPIFTQEGDPLSFFPKHFYHYNAKGYSLVAQKLHQLLPALVGE